MDARSRHHQPPVQGVRVFVTLEALPDERKTQNFQAAADQREMTRRRD
jgi:hypothetical protein